MILKFSDYTTSQGYMQLEEGNGEQMYCFSFPDGKWFGLSSMELMMEPKLPSVAEICAKAFDTYVVTAYVVDSDFVMLQLLNSDGLIEQKALGMKKVIN